MKISRLVADEVDTLASEFYFDIEYLKELLSVTLAKIYCEQSICCFALQILQSNNVTALKLISKQAKDIKIVDSGIIIFCCCFGTHDVASLQAGFEP